MTAMYVVYTPMPGLGGYAFAVAADDTTARYVFDDGSDSDGTGLDSDRIKRLAEWSTVKPKDALDWIGIASNSLGYPMAGDPVEAKSLKDAVAAATEAVKAAGTFAPNPTRAPGEEPASAPSSSPGGFATREERMQFERDALDEWALEYPEAASGDVNDPEADLALVHLMTPPVDPTKPHKWLPMATAEVNCGFCDLPADDAIHTAGADTITRGAN